MVNRPAYLFADILGIPNDGRTYDDSVVTLVTRIMIETYKLQVCLSQQYAHVCVRISNVSQTELQIALLQRL